VTHLFAEIIVAVANVADEEGEHQVVAQEHDAAKVNLTISTEGTTYVNSTFCEPTFRLQGLAAGSSGIVSACGVTGREIEYRQGRVEALKKILYQQIFHQQRFPSLTCHKIIVPTKLIKKVLKDLTIRDRC
jgi:hypothetical protein